MPVSIAQARIEAFGEILFQPAREKGSDWGRYECWKNCTSSVLPPVKPGDPPRVALVAQGDDWIAWDSETENYIGFPGSDGRKNAEQFCVAMNDGKPTRVYNPLTNESSFSEFELGDWEVSFRPNQKEMKLDFFVRNRVSKEIDGPFGKSEALKLCKEKNGNKITRVVKL